MKHVNTIIAALAVIVLAACEKETFISNIATSEVADSGRDATVTVEANDGGTTISYKSWIQVYGQTRAEFDSKFSIELINSLKNVKENVTVANWATYEPKVKTSRKATASKHDAYIKTTDSVQVYTVDYGTIKFEYPLTFQVAEYDDGYTKITMPYYGYDEIVNNDMTVKSASSVEKDGKAYARRIYNHSITVMVNRETYVVTNEVVASRPIEKINGKYILSSNMVEKSLLPLKNQDGRAGFVSKAKVTSEYSDGTKDTETFTETAYAYGENTSYHPANGNVVKIANRADLQFKKATLKIDAKSIEKLSSGSPYLLKTLHTDILELDLGVFTTEIAFKRENVYLDNGILYEPLTDKMMFDENSVRVIKTTWTSVEDDIYNVEVKIQMTINGKAATGYITFFAKN